MIQPIRQSLSHSCLTAVLLMLLQEKREIKDITGVEARLTLKGSKRVYPFYVVGIVTEVAKNFKVSVRIIADNTYFANVLRRSFPKKVKVGVESHPITLAYINEHLKHSPLVCHIDIHGFGDYSHASHFVIIEKASASTYTIIDPWTGKRKRIAQNTLKKAIDELKNHTKMCPLLLKLS